MNVIEASSNIPIFINPKRIGFTDFYDGGTITANASTIFLEMNKNVTHLDSVWQRKSPIDVQKDLKEISLNKWFPLAIGSYFMKLRMLNESVLCEKYQNALCEIGGVKVVLSEDYATSERSDGTTIDLPKSNVLKYYLEDGSWIAARPSGTEPKCKFYFSIKGTDAKDAADKTEVFHKAMMEIIGE